MYNIDFLSYKTIFRYSLLISLTLICGAILKNSIAIVFVLAIFYYVLSNNLFKTLELLIIWLSVSNFFLGQEYITNEIITKYIAKPSFLLFVIFTFYVKDIPTRLLTSKSIVVWVIFLVVALLSSITQGQSPFVIITISSFFFMYLLFQTKRLELSQYYKFLNLFIAIAVIQTFISF